MEAFYYAFIKSYLWWAGGVVIPIFCLFSHDFCFEFGLLNYVMPRCIALLEFAFEEEFWWLLLGAAVVTGGFEEAFCFVTDDAATVGLFQGCPLGVPLFCWLGPWPLASPMILLKLLATLDCCSLLCFFLRMHLTKLFALVFEFIP